MEINKYLVQIVDKIITWNTGEKNIYCKEDLSTDDIFEAMTTLFTVIELMPSRLAHVKEYRTIMFMM